MNRAAMITAVKLRCDYTVDANIGTWLNDAYKILARIARIPAESDPLTISNAYSLYDLPTNLADFDKIKLTTEDDFMEPTSETEIDTDETGQPTHYFLRGNKIGFYPIPDTTYTVKMHYFKYPSELTQDADSPDARIPAEFHNGIVEYAIAMAKEADGMYKSASYFWGKWEAVKTKFEGYISSFDPTAYQIEEHW